jgi:hypothetical protein
MHQSSELLKYHPNRYVHSRGFFRPLFNLYRQSAYPDGVPPASASIKIGNKLILEHWNPELDKYPVEQRPENLIGMLADEQDMFAHVARFTLCGRNIFHLSPTLTGLLQMTDVDDVLWGSIKLPYPAFYIWFGPQQEWRFGSGRYCADGAYVSAGVGGGGIQIFVTTIEPETDYRNPPSFAIHRDFYYYIGFRFADAADTVGKTLARTVETDVDFQRDIQTPQVDPAITRLATERGAKLLQKSSEETAQAKKVEERIADLPVFRQVLRLLINGLCYLSSPSREVVRKYPQPVNDVLAEAASTAQAKREKQQLRKDGYTEIHFCGESLEREYSAGSTGKELSPHWRRGHWRNQACGTARLEHHLMWIRPTLVRKDKQTDGDTVGHVYHVSK